MVVKSIVHFEIPAADVEKLSRFYSEVFGWKFEKSPPMGEMDYWMISTGPRRKGVGGGMYRKMGPEDRPRNYIAVDRIDEAIAAFTAAGGKQLVEKQEVPGFGWSYLGLDPEGNAVGLFEAITRGRTRPARRATRRAGRKSRS